MNKKLKEKYTNSKRILSNRFCWRSNLGHDDIISQRPGLRTGAKIDICWPSGYGQ